MHINLGTAKRSYLKFLHYQTKVYFCRFIVKTTIIKADKAEGAANTTMMKNHYFLFDIVSISWF